MRKPSLFARLRYRFDNTMAKGTVPLIMLLLAITAAVVVVIGVIAWLVNAEAVGSVGNSIWQNLMHAIDAGTLAGDDVGHGVPFIILMTLTTVCGIFITSMLIGLINSGLESKFDSLRKGDSKVIETDHTVILGFDNRIYVILNELIQANENRKKPRIVILGSIDKETMDGEIRDRIADPKNTLIITRSGDTADTAALARCSVENSRSIIINEADDAHTIRTILAVTNYLRSHPECTAHITAVVYSAANVDVARIAGENRAEIVYFADAMSRIIAHTCCQPGLSAVYTELFSFAGNEIYMETIQDFYGMTFEDTLMRLKSVSVIGVKHEGKAYINPPMDTIIMPGDDIILIAADDGMAVASEPGSIDETAAVREKRRKMDEPEMLLVLGHNSLLTGMLLELDRYVCHGSIATIACDDEKALKEVIEIRRKLENLELETRLCDTRDRNVLEDFVRDCYSNIVVLSSADSDSVISDANTLMILLHLRDIAKKTGAAFSVTSEMLDVRNQELARITDVNDFVVSSNLTSLMMSQISENRLLADVFTDLLDEEGSEIYVKPARDYVATGKPVNFYTVTGIAAERGEVFIGYKDVTRAGGKMDASVRLNPPKTDTITFDDDDMIFVIAED